MTQREEIEQLRTELSAMPDSPKKTELLAQLDRLQPEEESASTVDDVLKEVRANFSKSTSTFQTIKRKAMKNKFVPILLIGVGIAIVVFGYKAWKKNKAA